MKRITSLEVKKLFGRYDYSIDNISQQDLRILFGANGCGKTTLLKILDDAAKLKISDILEINFENLKISYDDSCYLEFVKDKEKTLFNIKSAKKKIKSYDLSDKDKVFIDYIRKSSERRYHEYIHIPSSGMVRRRLIEEKPIHYILYSPENDIEYLEKIFADDPNNKAMEFLNLLKEFKSSCKFISADRLISLKNNKHHSDNEQSIVSGIENIIKQIDKEISDAAERYSQLSQEKDSSYVKRLIRNYSDKDKERELVFKKIEELKKRIDKLVSLGISTDNFNEHYSTAKINKGSLHALDIYCDDTNEKLNVYKELETKLSSFFELMNLIFDETQKKIRVNNNKIEIYDNIRKCKLDVNMLSSGEKHQIILLGDIIFSSANSNLIIIDEPEISLHVKWQESFIDNIIDILRRNKVNLIIATHSPFIINKYWDYTQKLGSIEE